MKLSNQAMGAIMMALQKSLLEQSDITPILREFDFELTEEVAFLSYNFAPPTIRRNIGMFGFLHKRVLGKAHPCFQKLLPFHADVCD